MNKELNINEIKGLVLYNEYSKRENIFRPKGIKDIKINLYLVKQINKYDGEGKSISVLQEERILKTKTNENGEFNLSIKNGIYSISIDVTTLPIGVGVIKDNITFRTNKIKEILFEVRDVENIEVSHEKLNVFLGEPINFNLNAKDINGNNLIANINYKYDKRYIDYNKNWLAVSKKALEKKKFDIDIEAGRVRKKVSINIEVPKHSDIDKINIDFETGLINKQTKILYYLHSIFDKNRLPKKYKSTHPIKNVTNIIEEVQKYIGLKHQNRNIIKVAKKYFKYSIPKLEKNYISKSGYFRINYSLSGNNRVNLEKNSTGGVPNYIKEIGEVFDNVKEKTCNKAGFRKPIIDADKKYFEVYVYDLDGIFGMTFSAKFYKVKGFNTSVASSYICIDNNYSAQKGFDKSKLDCMKVTVAHEFFHSVQYGYNVNSDIWWKEASATWNEDEIYNGIDDYMRYLSSYFKTPYESLDTSNYGGVLFAKFLSENFGGGIIKRIWELETIINKTSVDAIDKAIKERLPGEDMGTIFNKFTAYNFNPKQYYQEGELWKISPSFQNIHNEYPVDITKNSLNHLSANYELFRPSKKYGNKSLKIIFEGDGNIRWGVKIQKRKLNDVCYITTIPIQKKYQRTQIIVNNFNREYKEVCLIPANLEKEKDGGVYNYTARLE